MMPFRIPHPNTDQYNLIIIFYALHTSKFRAKTIKKRAYK